MISRIKGTLDYIDDTTATVNVGGLYYEIMLPSALAESLRNTSTIGSEITFHILDYIESASIGNQYPRMVGFADQIDKEFFSIFTSVSGLGIKKALKSLIIPISDIARAIETNDIDALKKLPGIGPRLAKRPSLSFAAKPPDLHWLRKRSLSPSLNTSQILPMK
jgi:Holliday junction DNA helicase RuvA